MDTDSNPEADDDRPPICPACGVTMGIIVDAVGAARHICLECGFSDEVTVRPAYHERRIDVESDRHER